MSNGSHSEGMGVAGSLGVAFIVLKLCGVITWPWIWVLSPFWISFGFAILILLIMLPFIWKKL